MSEHKRVLAAPVNAPGSTHDARFLYHTAVIGNIIDGRVLPDKTIWDKNMGSKIPELLSY